MRSSPDPATGQLSTTAKGRAWPIAACRQPGCGTPGTSTSSAGRVARSGDYGSVAEELYSSRSSRRRHAGQVTFLAGGSAHPDPAPGSSAHSAGRQIRRYGMVDGCSSLGDAPSLSQRHKDTVLAHDPIRGHCREHGHADVLWQISSAVKRHRGNEPQRTSTLTPLTRCRPSASRTAFR